MNIKRLRNQKHLTQEELSIESGISIRTIQRIEAGQEPKGHTLKSLAKALELDLNTLNKKATKDLNYSLIKIINLSPAFVLSIPLLNIILPLAIIYFRKQFNRVTKQIVSLQIIWTIVSFVVFFLASFLKISLSLSHRFPLWVLLVFMIFNMIIIIKNTSHLDKHKKLFFKLNFNII